MILMSLRRIVCRIFADGYTYALALNEALVNDGSFHAILLQSLTHSKNQTYPLFYPNVDWMDEALRGASYGDNISFSARGGGKFVRYYTMLNFWIIVVSCNRREIMTDTQHNLSIPG